MRTFYFANLIDTVIRKFEQAKLTAYGDHFMIEINKKQYKFNANLLDEIVLIIIDDAIGEYNSDGDAITYQEKLQSPIGQITRTLLTSAMELISK